MTRFVTPGDKIFVPVAEVFYISGQVKSPGNFPIHYGMTLTPRRSPGAAASRIRRPARRRSCHPGRQVSAKMAATEHQVQPEDVLVVGEKLF